MEDTLIINGVTYIRQSQVAEMEQNLENIRQIVNSALNDVSALVNGQSVAQSNNQVTKTVTKKKAEALLDQYMAMNSAMISQNTAAQQRYLRTSLRSSRSLP